MPPGIVRGERDCNICLTGRMISSRETKKSIPRDESFQIAERKYPFRETTISNTASPIYRLGKIFTSTNGFTTP